MTKAIGGRDVRRRNWEGERIQYRVRTVVVLLCLLCVILGGVLLLLDLVVVLLFVGCPPPVLGRGGTLTCFLHMVMRVALAATFRCLAIHGWVIGFNETHVRMHGTCTQIMNQGRCL